MILLIIFWILAGLSHILPFKLAVFITERIADFMYFTFYAHGKRNWEANVKKIKKNLTKFDLRRLSAKNFRNFAKFIYEFLILPRFNKKENLERYLEVKNIELLDDALKEGGAIVLTAHLGNWELGATMLSVYGYSPLVIAYPWVNEGMKRFYRRRREKAGMRVVYLDEPMLCVFKQLKKGGVVATLGDRDYTGTGDFFEFFGIKTRFPTGIFKIAEKTGAKVLPAFCVREGDNYKVYFEKPVDNPVDWIKIFEMYVDRYLTQWYLYERL